MKKRRTATPTVLCLFLLVLLMSFSSAAQETPRLEVFAGYSHLRFDSVPLGFADFSNLNGWNGGVTFNLTRQFSVVGEIGGQSGPHLKFYDGLIGPQLSYRKWGATFFGHVLFGRAKTHVDVGTPVQDSGRATAFGGGVDINVHRMFAIRLLQADYVTTHTFQTDQSNVRLSAGIVFRWNKFMIKGHKPATTQSP